MRWMVLGAVLGLASSAHAQASRELGSPWGPRDAPVDAAEDVPLEPDGEAEAIEPLAEELDPVADAAAPEDASGPLADGSEAPVALADVAAVAPVDANECPTVEAPPPRPRTRVYSGSRRRVSLLSEEDGVYAFVCEAPCEVQLEPGTYELGVGIDDDAGRRPDHHTFTIDGDEWLEVVYSNRHAHRVGAAIMLGVGVPTGLGMLLGGLFALGFGLFIPGAIVLAFSVLYGIPAAFVNDHVDIREHAIRF